MKKLYSICLIALSMFILVSCVEESKDDESNLNPIISLDPTQPNENTYWDKEVSFSLDKGVNWKTFDDRLTEFDICDVKYYEEVPGMVFFYVTSFNQLVEKVENYKSNSFYFYGCINDENWKWLLDTYNDEYFKDNILLFYYKHEPSISENYVYNVVIKDNSLILNINRFEGMDTALSTWIHIVTVKKENVDSITEFSVVVRTISKL